VTDSVHRGPLTDATVLATPLPLDEIRTSWIHGVEVYQISEIPSQYRGRGLCGLILVWTK
jgi:hypothetical protein